MRAQHFPPALALALATACTPPPTVPHDATPAPLASLATPAPPSAPTAAPTAAPAPDVLDLDVTFHGPGALTIKNKSKTPTRLRSRVRLERLDAGQWVDTGHANMQLIETCSAQPPDCTTLAPGAVLHPMAWTGFLGCTQCPTCDKNYPAPPAKYRFVLLACTGDALTRSPELEIKPTGKITGPPWSD